MKKNYFNQLFVVLVLGTASIYAQQNPKIEKQFLDKQGNLTLAKFSKDSKLSVNSAKQAIIQTMGMENVSFKKSKLQYDELGFEHEKQQQFHKGLKVEFGAYTFHNKDGAVQSVSGKSFKIDKNDISANFSSEGALEKAIEHVKATKYLWEEDNAINYKKPEGELVILPVLEGVSEVSRLVYKFDVYSVEPLYRADVYVDAQTGEVVFENYKIHHVDTPASGASLYNDNVSFTCDLSGSTYSLESSQIETYDMNESTNYNNASRVTSSSSFFSGAATAVQAHWGAEQTYEYFLTKHGRDSYNDNGAVIRSYVSYNSNYVNAFWDGSRMTYGDGDGVNYGPLVSLDIVGHEIAHGVTQYAANLIYSYESGALNESFSDIFGESVEFYAQGSNDWLMGDHIGAGGSGGALRSMSNPNIFNQPDTYYGDSWYTGAGDNGGVHYNSGVQNFWFYLLSVGGSGTNDNGDSYSVTQIGMDAAAAVAYRNLEVYLSASSQYDDAREGAIQAAIDLFGEGSTEVIAVTNAWYAVGIGDAYGGGGTDPEVPTECSATVSSFPYSESFEFGDGWTQVSGDDGNWINDNSGTPSTGTGPSAAADGSFYMFLEASTNGSAGQIGSNATAILESPCFNLTGETTAAFTFQNHMYGTSVGSLTLQISLDEGVTWTNIWSQSADQGDQWNQESVSLDSYLDEASVRLRFVGTTGSSWSSDIAIDDLELVTDGSGGDDGDEGEDDDNDDLTYCNSEGTDSSFEWIDYVSFAGIENATGDDGGYADYTNNVATVALGSTNTIVFSCGFSGTSYTEFWAVWIDFDQNGTFDNDELVTTGSSSSADNLSATISIPTTANLGTTRMRVSMKYNAEQTACETFQYGEVEDYTVNISNSAVSTFVSDKDLTTTLEFEEAFTLKTFPNPALKSVQINLEAESKVSYTINNIVGKLIEKGNVTDGVIDVSTLAPGMYLLQANDGQKTFFTKLIKQ